jgi:hypothetical protein
MKCFLTKRIKISIFILFWEELFLSKAERNFFLQRQGMDKNKQRYIRHKLRRKIKHLSDNELPLLVEQGYIAGNVAANSCGVAAGSHSSHSQLQLGKKELNAIEQACKLM